jgi:hypothetical protein
MTPAHITVPVDPTPDLDTLASTYLEAIKAAAKKVEECLRQVKDMMKWRWDWSCRLAVEYREGDLVLVSSDW